MIASHIRLHDFNSLRPSDALVAPSHYLNQCCNIVNWTEPLRTNFSEILIKILTFSFKKIHFKVSSAKWQPFCLGLNVLTHRGLNKMSGDDILKWVYMDENLDIFKWVYMDENLIMFHMMSMKLFPWCAVEKSVLVQVMARHRGGAEPLPKPMLTQFTDGYITCRGKLITILMPGVAYHMRTQASMC